MALILANGLNTVTFIILSFILGGWWLLFTIPLGLISLMLCVVGASAHPNQGGV